MASLSLISMSQRQQRSFRPRLNTCDNDLEDARTELLSHHGYLQQTSSRNNYVKNVDMEEGLALAIALSKSMMTAPCNTRSKPTVKERSTTTEPNCEQLQDQPGPRNQDEVDCNNDYAIALALSNLEGASSCIADLESIQLEEEDTTTIYDSGIILVSGDQGNDDDDDDDDDWSCVIEGDDLEEVLMFSRAAQQETPEEDRWSIVSKEGHDTTVSEEVFLPSYKQVVECFSGPPDSPNRDGTTAQQPLSKRRNNPKQAGPIRPVLRPTSLDELGNIDPFMDWEHYKNGRGGKASLQFKGNQRSLSPRKITHTIR